jgi:hypothetical protein
VKGLPSVLLVAAVLLGAGCQPDGRRTPPDPPAGGPQPNSRTPEHWVPRRGHLDEGDAVVLARLASDTVYAKVRRGDWEDHWHLFVFDVLAVERGSWSPKRVVVAAADAWPTPESGIVLGRPVWPYMPGRYYALALRTAETPPLVVGQEDRSYLEPHGPRMPAAFDLNKPEGRALYGRIVEAAGDAVKAPGGAPVVYEETPAGWVVEVRWASGGTWAGSAWFVGRADFSARPAP